MTTPVPTLDERVRTALAALARGDAPKFNVSDYGRSFHESARGKAAAVLSAVSAPEFPLKGKRPVIISIGGADGEELNELMLKTDASVGILLENSRELAEVARKRILPAGKTIEVFEGDAVTKVDTVIERSTKLIREGKGDYRLVSIHAVIHELFDRGTKVFDPGKFFGTIFSDKDISTWFTYREPGAPEKWPDDILLSAKSCSSSTLLELARKIRERHQAFRDLPEPSELGDSLRAHKDLAMEVVVKLFYLDVLSYELEERSTSVDHRRMTSFLSLAIGNSASLEGRGAVALSSAPTGSFQKLWTELGIRADGLDEKGGTITLAIPESQTRVIAYRVRESAPSSGQPTPGAASGAQPLPGDVALAKSLVGQPDKELLSTLLVSRGRRWIEISSHKETLDLMRTVVEQYEKSSIAHIWSHYLLSLADIFSGSSFSPELFSESWIEAAVPYGLDPLFRAERMELLRKSGDLNAAATLANAVINSLPTDPVGDETQLARYSVGTSYFVISNLLRAGGLYSKAYDLLNLAEVWLVPGVDSHDTERLHCHYARSVCEGIRGSIIIDSQFPSLSSIDQKFARGLIHLTYVNASWFVKDLDEAARYAQEAISLFEEVGVSRYVKRARTVLALLQVWRRIENGQSFAPGTLEPELETGIRYLTGEITDSASFSQWFCRLRPSTAAGLLQFKTLAKAEPSGAVKLPPLLDYSDGKLEWRERTADTLIVADRLLRTQLGTALGRRIPLLSD